MKNTLLKKVQVLAWLILLPILAHAAPDYEVHNITENINGIWASANTDVFIGPNAVITVSGDWYITATNLYIHPSATITGAGTIHLMNPSTYGASAAATNLDAGGTIIGCKLSIENGNTIVLTSINLLAAGFSDPGGAGTNDLVMANNLNFNNTGAHVVLGNYNVQFTSAAAATVTYNDLNIAGFTADPAPGAAYTAYLVTGGSGVVIKQGLGANAAFTYPVGQSGPLSAPYDYTPATVTNTDAAVHNISLKVQSYAGSTATEGSPAKGMNRTWNIYSDAASPAIVALMHNSGNSNAGSTTNGSSFINTAAFVTQQVSAGVWSADSATSNGGTPVSTHSGSFTLAASGSAATAFFTKSSDIINSLDSVLAVSPVVMLQGAMSGTTMTTKLNVLNLIPQTQPYGTLFSYNGKEKVSAVPANVTDWVLVELRDAVTPSTVVARRAAFVKNDGTIVDIDGASSIGFSGVAAGSYYVSIRHRNHLGIRTPTSLNLTLNAAPVAYNFTTGQAQAYQNGTVLTNPAMKDMGNGVFAMWGGNGANTGSGASTIRATGAPVINDYSAILTSLSGASSISPVYNYTDYNMDGTARATGAPAVNDYTFLLNVLGTNISLTQHL